MRKFAKFILLFLFMIPVAACQTADAVAPLPQVSAPSAAATIGPPPELDAGRIAQGKVVYDQNCAACHGLNLEGQPDWKIQNEDGSFKAPPHNADGHTWHHADDQLIESIQLGGDRFAGMDIGGTSPMPAYADILSDEEIMAVLTYIKSTWAEDVRRLQWEVTAMSSQQ